jgi:hypothetical protein
LLEIIEYLISCPVYEFYCLLFSLLKGLSKIKGCGMTAIRDTLGAFTGVIDGRRPKVWIPNRVEVVFPANPTRLVKACIITWSSGVPEFG